MQPKFLALIPALLAAALAGCQSSQVNRLVNTTFAGAAGGLTANQLSNGNPYWTLAGGVTAIGISEYARTQDEKRKQEELALAYEQGRAQNAHVTYAAIQNAQQNGFEAGARTQPEDNSIEIPFAAPARVINGVKINPTTEYIKVSAQ
ncbi:hypothetical protein AW736_26425 [Termitidicoccus mucosus]|uniref:Uncharacterized protein n=1 Tax=Termitidicoccus mucosus TaxID=1184151 RepID=A0A178IR84_9BACT|nr:hypothetical protein AW736_26425 [Opitutaceae bacterium TSB47]